MQIVNFTSYVFTAHDHIYSYFFTFVIALLKYWHQWGRFYKFSNERNLQNTKYYTIKTFYVQLSTLFWSFKMFGKKLGSFLSIVTTLSD